MIKFFLAWISLWICGAYAGGVDLHNHALLEHGVPTWFYNGCFNCPLQAKDYSDLRSSKCNEQTLLQSDLDVVVVSLHAVSTGPHTMRDSIRLQIQAAKKFVAENPSWILAVTPFQALKGLKQKKKIMILSLEGAHGVLENDEDIREFIQDGPITMVTPLHLTDDDFGGAAFMWKYFGFVNFFPYIKSFFNPMEMEGVRINPAGLGEKGEWLVRKLLDLKVWIDLTHASDRTQMAMISLMAKGGQPLLYTHTALREYHGAERGLAQWQIEEIKQKGGVVGLLPSRDYLNGTSAPDDFAAFALQYKELANEIGRDHVTIGSDFNAPIRHLGPGGDWPEPDGFWNPTQVGLLWKRLNKVQPTLFDDKTQVREFIRLWSKVR